jgi:hypothetical protein
MVFGCPKAILIIKTLLDAEGIPKDPAIPIKAPVGRREDVDSCSNYGFHKGWAIQDDR